MKELVKLANYITGPTISWDNNRAAWVDQLTLIDHINAIEDEARESYMRLPTDMNGEPWHVGDYVDIDGKGYQVIGIAPATIYYVDGDGVQWTRTKGHAHYHKQTVEEILTEMLKHFGAIEEVTDVVEDYIEKYAEKLQLREE